MKTPQGKYCCNGIYSKFTILQAVARGDHPQRHPARRVAHVFQNTKLFNGCYRQGLMIGGNPLKTQNCLVVGFGWVLGNGWVIFSKHKYPQGLMGEVFLGNERLWVLVAIVDYSAGIWWDFLIYMRSVDDSVMQDISACYDFLFAFAFLRAGKPLLR